MTELPNGLAAWLSSQLWGDSPELVYALLDGARDPSVRPSVAHSGLPYACLFEGDLVPELAEAAPYLVQLKKGAQATQQLLELGWGKSFGIFATSPLDLEEMRRHFRRFLQVQTESGKRLFFRYYDPRVFRVYLPTCNEGELRGLFGPVVRYLAEAEDGQALISYHREGAGLFTSTVVP